MKIVFLERKSLGDDLDLDYFNKLGEVVVYQTTSKEQIAKRIYDADVIIANKAPLIEETLKDAVKLKLICLTATGTNNVEFAYTDTHGIIVKNVSSYSTDSVVQHTFAMMFYLLEKLNYYDNYVKSGEYARAEVFSYFAHYFYELKNKTWGIIGLGEIGKSVADVAKAFGCEVIYYSTSGRNNNSSYKRVELDELLESSDIVSIHAPLNDVTDNLIAKEQLKKMKKSAILINVGRGCIVNEADLAWALENDIIMAAGIDVLSKEPIEADNPLMRIKDSEKLIITPHMAWGTVESRERLMRRVYENIVQKDY